MTRAFVYVRKACGAMVLASLALIAACTQRDAGADAVRDSASVPDSINIAKERSEDLTGDGTAEKITLTARGSRMDSLRVQLRISSPGDSVLYESSWDSHFYFQYVERAGLTDAAADSIVRRHLDAVLADTAFRTVATGTGTDTIPAMMMRDAIRYDIATHRLRVARGLRPGTELPRAAHDSVNVLAAAVSRADIDTLFRELRGRKSFTYFAGGEVTYSIAWSDREQRFVTVFSCC